MERNPFSPSSLLFIGLPLPLPPPVADKASIDPEDTEKKLRILQMDPVISNSKNVGGAIPVSIEYCIHYSILCLFFTKSSRGKFYVGNTPIINSAPPSSRD